MELEYPEYPGSKITAELDETVKCWLPLPLPTEATLETLDKKYVKNGIKVFFILFSFIFTLIVKLLHFLHHFLFLIYFLLIVPFSTLKGAVCIFLSDHSEYHLKLRV